MEIPHLNSDDNESLSDTTKKKEKKTKKIAPFIHVPVPVQIEAAKNVPPEAERAMAELGDDDKTKKRKKTKKKVGHTILADAESTDSFVPIPLAEQVDTKRRNIEQQEAEEPSSEDDEDDEEDEEQEATTPESKKTGSDKEYLGELLISDRARRLHEIEELAAAESVEEIDEEVAEEESDRALLEQLAAEMAELDDAALESTTASEDEPDDTTTTASSTTVTSGTGFTAIPSPPPIPVGSSGSTPPVPFTSMSSGGGSVPPVPFMAAGAANMYPAGPNVMAVPTAVNPVETAPTRNAERRGLLTGLLVGGLIEHVRHKRRERRMEKEHAQTIKGMNAEQQATALQAAEKAKSASRKQTALETQLSRLKEQITRTVPEQPSVAERPRPVSATESFKAATVSEQRMQSTGEKTPEEAAKTRAALEQAWAAEQEAFEKQREVPDDRRIETSAWHSIEVDKKTGKAVEDPTLEYGEEFKYEQHQEQLRRDVEAASIESASMRERYVDPHLQRPSQQEYAAMGASQTTQKNELSAAPVERQYDEDKSGIEVVDIILWSILAVVVVIIFRVLTA